MTLELSVTGALTLAEVEAVAMGDAGPQVALSRYARTRLADMRQAAMAALAANPGRPIYGFNRGFGSNALFPVDQSEAVELQQKLILSHTANVGPCAPAEVVRAAMLLRAQSLAVGRSTVRPELVERLLALLNARVTPAVPRFGSVSASGDLSPLSHIAVVLMGKGRVLLDQQGRAAFGAETIDTPTYLQKAPQFGLPVFEPIALDMKEGLALNNGCQYSAAWAILAAMRMRRLLETATITTALGVQAMLGSGGPFRKELHALRRHPSAQQVAQWVYDLIGAGYPLRDTTESEKVEFDGDIQDPYNLRCAAQILGPCLDLITRAETTLTQEANSVTDNPIDLNEGPENYNLDKIVSGGHFHGMPIAVDAYGLLQAAGIMARLSNMRCARYVDARRNKGLGPQVRGDHGRPTESGLQVAEYATAGLCNHIWALAAPSHLMSISTDSGQEDHVSMAANVAMRAYEASERLAEILAVELAFASQALSVRAAQGAVATRAIDPELGPELPAPQTATWRGAARTVNVEKRWSTPLQGGHFTPSALTAGVIAKMREVFPPVAADRELAWDIMALAEKVASGEIAKACGLFARH